MPLVEHALTTLETVKEELSISDNDNDALLMRYINSASDFIIKYVERDLVKKAYTDERYSGNSSVEIYLKNYPIVSIEKIEIDNYELVESDEDYELSEEDKKVGRIYRELIWPRVSKVYGDLTNTRYEDDERNITISYTAGYCTPKQEDAEECTRDLPYDLEDVCIGLVSRRYNIHCAGAQGQSNIAIGQFKTTWLSIIDDEYKAVLEKYKRRS